MTEKSWSDWAKSIQAKVGTVRKTVHSLIEIIDHQHDHAQLSRSRLSAIENRLARIDGGEGHAAAVTTAYGKVRACRDEAGKSALSFTLQTIDGELMFVPRNKGSAR